MSQSSAAEIVDLSSELLPAAARPSANAAQVLVVDASVDFREMMAQALDRNGFASIRHPTLDAFDAAAPPLDVAILEIEAGRGGLGRIAKLRQCSGWHDVPIICVSHFDSAFLRVLALDSGGDDFLVKPVHSDELVARVRAQLRRAQRIGTLLAQSRVDTLTGILNRRGGVDELEKALAWSRRSGEACSVLLLDVDGLKQVNDGQGHAAGDQLLVAVATALQASARREDSVARLGGDEFVVVLPRADAAGARRAAQRIEARLRQIELPGISARVRASIGIATSAPGPTDAEQLIAEADARMYADKRRARARRAALHVVASDEGFERTE